MNSVRIIQEIGPLFRRLVTAVSLLVCLSGCKPPTPTDYLIARIRPGVDAFRVDCGRLPTTKEGLAALLKNPGVSGWRGPYLTSATPFTDQWGTRLAYEAGTNYVMVRSAGPDKMFDTRDDIKTKWTW